MSLSFPLLFIGDFMVQSPNYAQHMGISGDNSWQDSLSFHLIPTAKNFKCRRRPRSFFISKGICSNFRRGWTFQLLKKNIPRMSCHLSIFWRGKRWKLGEMEIHVGTYTQVNIACFYQTMKCLPMSIQLLTPLSLTDISLQSYLSTAQIDADVENYFDAIWCWHHICTYFKPLKTFLKVYFLKLVETA